MHIPDGFLSAPVWGAMDITAIPAVAYLARRAQRGFDSHKAPLMGVMGAFVFAAQTINFPIGNGTSGHLVGGALLSFTLGPAAASVVMTAILAVQALIFQDGGVLAGGANILNMAIAGVLAGYAPYALLRGSRTGVFLGGFLSVVVSGTLALTELLLSGVSMRPAVLGVSIGLFVLAAVIEGAITLAVVQGLERIQPGLLRKPQPVSRTLPVLVGVGALTLATSGCYLASTSPDQIEHVGRAAGIWQWTTHLFQAPLANYNVVLNELPWLGKAAAGLTGITIVYAICLALSRLLIATRPVLEREEGR